MEKDQVLVVESSPHVKSERSVPRIMVTVLILLFPLCITGIYFFGVDALVRIVISVIAALLAESIFLKLRKKSASAVLDGSAAITGIILALSLPPKIPLFAVVIGSGVAITIGKQLFGGLGCNIFNPALVGRAFLQAAFPVEMTTWVRPFDSVSSATPLGDFKFSQISPENMIDLFWGNTGGCIGETSGVLIIILGVLLLLFRMADWRIPLSILSTVTVMSGIIYLINADKFQDPTFHLFSGGLMLGAFFMATDMVTSPVTPKASVIYGIGIGVLIMVIRTFGGLPEGVMYSILLMNSVVPLLNRYTKPRIFGEGAK